ncbi:DNA mismatch repair endonuclease MutL [Sulfitobacter sp. R18_1]|uniref:DNA mismatch repair endonuclease MutL n=1 Tax=Sulfitobacter sp. R18_1 TaxID=2821104 RepID=UPI001FFE0FBE|nr:DNA mismatch repair endonuclease MutL [Sulfitobacter sp. R18_1]
MGRTINKIDEQIVRYLAASEVVERPLSVVKELVDNALDSGARTISVRVVSGGQTSIEVSDDGEGISKSQLENAPKRHYSSKTSSLEDVLNPSLRGFRGEALHSIGSVASLTIISKQSGSDTAWKITVCGEEASSLRPAAGSVGTRVIVGRLFENVPVRRKLMNTARHDGNLISDYVRKMASLLPEVSFQLFKDNASPLDFRSCTMHERVQEVFGSEFLDQSTQVDIPFSVDGEEWELTGYIRPQRPGQRASKSRKAIMVNGFLVVEDCVVEAAVKRVWSSVFSISNRDFEYALHLKPITKTAFANFNAHPRKTKIEYYQEFRLQAALTKALQGFLEQENADISGVRSVDAGIDADHDAVSDERQPLGVAIAQYRDSYIIAQSDVGLIIVDQHAAHERIILEKMIAGINPPEVEFETRELSSAILVSEDFVVQAELLAQEDELRNIGFRFATEHHLTYATHVPKLDGWVPSTENVLSYFSTIRGDSPQHVLLLAARDLANKACKRAIKSGHVLTLREMNDFLRMMEATPSSFTCNHGRPTVRKIPHEDLLSMFDR